MRVVSGVIKDNDGEPIIGVTVQEKGTTNATMTDLDGYYQIVAPLGSKLEFRLIGMKPSEMVITTSNSKPSTGVTKTIKPVIPELKAKEPAKEEPRREPKKTATSREDQSLSPYFMVKSNSPDEAWMPLKKTDVEVNIAGVIADVCVKQIYINESKNTLEAIYVFPGSTRAAVYAMAMTIGDRRIEAQIKKKEQARKEYEEAKEQGKSATLLEQHRPNVFQMNVANILPGDTIVVEMRYTELLENLAGTYEFVYPTVVGPRYSETGEDWVDQTISRFESGKNPEFSIRTIIQAGMPIQKISSITHNLAIESKTPDQAVISLSNPKDDEGNRDYILQYELQGGKVESGLLRYEHGDENFFLLMMQPPKKPTLEQIPPREYVFIVDVSGSMYGFPLSVSKKLIRNLVSGLRPIDRFNVMLFESSNAMLYKESVAATEVNIQKAIEVIDKQQGGGGTRLYPAIVNAMNFKETEGFSRTFIIVTDGFVTVEKEAFNYVRSNLNKANLFPFGIGPSVNRYLIEGLAHAGMGTPYMVTNQTQAEAIGKRAIEEISQPVLTNISIDWGDFDVYDVEPVAIPDVFAERPILVYGKYKSPVEGIISVSGLSGNFMYKQEFDVTNARKEHNQALRYLWARNQIRYYDDYAQYYEGETNAWNDYYGNHKRSPKQIEYVTNLGLKYNLLTQYTSFLAVDKEIRTPKYAEPDDAKPSSTPRSRTSTPQNVSAPDFQLTEDASSLDEVVVVGFGSVRRERLTGAVSSISSNELSVAQSLQGRVAGLQISQTSGEPGDASRVRIRGASSLIGNNNPLVVIDGTPVEYSDFSQMNMNDIESISVLKDASATAIYGSRAANGVLVISTKEEKYKKFSVSLSSSFSIETPNKLPKLQSQYAQGRPENGVPVWNKGNEAFSWGPDVNAMNAPTYDAYDIFRTGYSVKNFLTFTGRSNNKHYTLKYGNNIQEGFIPESNFKENTLGIKFGNGKNSDFNYDISLDYKNTRGNRLQRGYNMSSIMRGILLTPPTFNNEPSILPDGSQRKAGAAADNPYWAIDNNPFRDEANRLLGNVKLGYKLDNGLSFNYLLVGDYLSNEARTALNIGSVYNPTGHIMMRDEKFRSLLSRLSANFNKRWDDFDFTSTLGYEYSVSKRTIDRTDGYELKQAGNYNITNAGVLTPYDQLLKRHSNAAFGKAGVSYQQKLNLESALRTEWSSISNGTLISPSAGVSANLHEMFYSGIFNQIKLYANISKADKETPLYIDPMYFNSAIYNLNDASQHFESREVVLSDNLKPEKITHYEVGTNLSLLNNRLSLSASFYWKRAKDQLLPTQVSDLLVRLENYGSFKTNGFEAELSAYLVRNRNFSWDTRLIFSRERNRVTGLGGRKLMLAGIESAVGSYAIEGQPLGVLYGTAYERDQQGRMIIGSDGFPLVSNEPKVLGNPNPDWNLSWLHSLTFRNFSLSVLFDYKKGGDMWNGTLNAMNYFGTSQFSADQRNTTGYIFPGVLSDGRENNIPVKFYGNSLNDNRWVRYGQYGVGEDGIQDASYIKLREISLGYRIPLGIFHRRSYLNLSVFATNLLLYSKYKGVDPETNLTGSSNGFGLDYFNVPGVHSMGVSLKWDF